MSFLKPNQSQCLVLLRFHYFSFARSLVVDATKVEDAVDDDAVQFPFIRLVELFGIGSHSVQADKEVARNAVPFGLVEGDDIRVIIMLQVLTVYFQYLLVRAEDIGYFAHFLSVTCSHLFYPLSSFAFLNGGH